MAPPLEQILMQRNGVKYVDAKRVINKSRQALRMSRIEPWTEALKLECERRLLGSNSAQVRTSVIEETISENKAVVAEIKEVPKVEAKKHDPPEHDDTEPETDVSSRQDEDSQISEACSAEESTKAEESKASSDNSSPEQESSSQEKTEEDGKIKSEVEEIADDCSQATDHSKCFTTAEEIGIVLTKDSSKCVAATEELDNILKLKSEGAAVQEESLEEQTPEQEETPEDEEVHPESQTKERSRKSDDHTVDTGIETEIGIPLFIIIDKRRAPEVPLDEPLGECFNVPVQARPQRQRTRLGRKMMKRLRQRLTTMRNSSKLQIGRLREDDTEVFRQTLIDI